MQYSTIIVYNIDKYYRTSLKNTSVSGASWIDIIFTIIIIIIGAAGLSNFRQVLFFSMEDLQAKEHL